MKSSIKHLLLAILAVTLMACTDSDNESIEPVVEAQTPLPDYSFIRVTHASPDAPSINIVGDNGDGLTFEQENIDYQTATGKFPIFEGTYDVQVNAILPGEATTTVINTNLTFDSEFSYDLVAVGTTAEIIPIVIETTSTAVTNGSVRFQIVHGAPNAPEVDIYITAPDVSLASEQPIATAAFMDFTGQIELPAGDFQIRITPAGSSSVVFDSGVLSLEGGTDMFVVATQNVAAGDAPVSLLAARNGGDDFVIIDADAGADLRVVHGVADAPAVDIIVDNNDELVEGATFLASTDYLSLSATNYLVDIANAADNSLVLVDDAPITLENGGIYTAIANNTLANIGLDLMVDLPRPLATSAQVRIVHASTTAGDVDVYVTTNGDITDVSPAFSAVPFMSPMLAETGYVQLTPGDYYVTITNAGTKDSLIETGMLTLNAANIYTAIAVDGTGSGLLPQLILLDDFE